MNRSAYLPSTVAARCRWRTLTGLLTMYMNGRAVASATKPQAQWLAAFAAIAIAWAVSGSEPQHERQGGDGTNTHVPSPRNPGGAS